MPTDTKLNQLIINQLTQEQYDEAKAAGTLSDTELYITDSDDDPQVKSNLSQTIDDSTTKYPSNKAVKDESSRITTLMDTKVSNCITEIPQDIKLELNNGTITLKAGSKVYKGDGTVVTVNSDITHNALRITGKYFFVLETSTYIARCDIAKSYSQDTEPTDITTGSLWYNTTTKEIKRYNGSGWYNMISFPLCICSLSDGTITSIDQVFNGFGYIGSTIFALPGVKGLIPNGRNADGSLKSIEYTLDKVLTETFPNLDVPVYVTLKTNSLDYWQVAVTPIAYSETENFFINGNNIKSSELILGISYLSSGKITSFTPKTVFHALDYNDKSTISGWGMPSNKYINLTLGADDTTYVAPANGYFYLVKVAGNDSGYINFLNVTKNLSQEYRNKISKNWLFALMPAQKGDVFKIKYTATGDTKNFRFIYSEGEN